MPTAAKDMDLEIPGGVKYLYGTAGFRMRAEMMLPVAYRVGMLAAALSSHYDGQFIGIMLTASHNALPDNGVKLVAPTGEMLPSSWEHVAEAIANCPMEELETELTKHFGAVGKCSVVVGMDTRPSSPALREMVMRGARKLGGEVVEIGVVTTPELHTAVARFNSEPQTVSQLEDDYIMGLASAFQPVVGVQNKVRIVVDCANGVGALKVEKLKEKLVKTGYELVVVNGGEAELNHKCGADYVKTGNCPPRGDYKPDSLTHFASLDGDADRLVYFTFTDAGVFQLIDGDRISSLLAMAIKKLVQKSGLENSITMGVVQTAYANGGSTEFIEKTLGIPVVCTPTGVKHLHKAASGFDIGIYFEANGHGTVLFSENATNTLRTTRNVHSELLLAVSRLANQLVGDGIADLLLVEAMLKITKQSVNDWVELYNDCPSCLIKTMVKDRTRLKTTDADRSITEPVGLQTEIDKMIASVRGGRAFARPSGTEDVVRIFSEATIAEDATKLAADISARLLFLRPIRYGGPALAAAFFYSSKPNNQTGWSLCCGAYCAPKGPLDAKREARLECCGEDSFTVVENQFQSVVAVADGVGGWRAKGVDPSKFSRSLMRHLEAIIAGTSGWFHRGETPMAFISPTTLIRQAFWRLVGGYHKGKEQPFGSSTICVVSLDRSSGTLETANLGDSGFLLLRGREVILQSRAQQHRFNAPYQLTLAPDGNVSDCSHMSASQGCAVETGDVLILATDGLWDNLFEEDVTRLVAMGGEPLEMAKRLALEARRMSEKSDYQSPFSVEATRNGLSRLGGKEDDITVIVAVPQYIGEANEEK